MLTVSEERIQKEFLYDGLALVAVSIVFPSIRGEPKRAARRMNAYYKHAAKSLLASVKRRLVPGAVDEYKDAVEHGYPFRPYEVVTQFTVTLNNGALLSIYTDKYIYTGGAHGNTTRVSENWDAQTGWFREMRSFFPRMANYKRILTQNATAIAADQMAAGTHFYFDDYPALIRKYFNRHSFYMSPEGMNTFYGQYEIAPYSEGIPVFLYPLPQETEAETAPLEEPAS